MILQEELRSTEGSLLASKGQEVTSAVIFKLKNLHARGTIAGELMISTPKSSLAFSKGAS